MKQIKLTQGQFALVDDEDYDYLSQWKWRLYENKKKSLRYAIRRPYKDGKRITIRMHRVIMDTPSHLFVDHINHNGLDNQRLNLRNCTNQENCRNASARGKSKYLGVYYFGKYILSSICINGKTKYIGLFKTEEEAAMAYDKEAKLYFNDFANLNFK
jgi:hypothetical protein